MKNKIKDIDIERFILDNYEQIENASNIASATFRIFGWVWGCNPPKIPEYNEIQGQFEELIRECIKGNIECIETGRLGVTIYMRKDGPELNLYLCLN